MKLESLRIVDGDMSGLTVPSKAQNPSKNQLGYSYGNIGIGAQSGWADIPVRSMFGSGPGSSSLIAGDNQAGYFGAVPQSDLISYSRLASDLNVPGSLVSGYDTGNWLKFAYEGKTLFVAQRGIKTGVPWEHLYQLGIVYGDDTFGRFPYGQKSMQSRRITIGDVTYRVRLLTGSTDDPSTADDYVDARQPSLSQSEWTKLIVPVTDGTWTSFSDSDMGFINSGQTWCQESKGNDRILHGVSTAYDTFFRHAADTSSFRGWRPVLEVDA